MKSIKIIGLLFVFVLVFSNCATRISQPTSIELSQQIKVLVIDGCEYIQYPVELIYGNAYTNARYKAYFLTHKGNCKFCAERNKNK